MTYLAANCHPSPSAMPHVLCLSLLWILGCVSTAWAQPARFLHRQLMAPRAGMAVTPTQHLPAPEQAVLCQLLAQALPSPFHPQALSNLNVSGFVSFLKKKTNKQANKQKNPNHNHSQDLSGNPNPVYHLLLSLSLTYSPLCHLCCSQVLLSALFSFQQLGIAAHVPSTPAQDTLSAGSGVS